MSQGAIWSGVFRDEQYLFSRQYAPVVSPTGHTHTVYAVTVSLAVTVRSGAACPGVNSVRVPPVIRPSSLLNRTHTHSIAVTSLERRIPG